MVAPQQYRWEGSASGAQPLAVPALTVENISRPEA